MENELINRMANLTDKQFIDIFYKIAEKRKKTEAHNYESHLVLFINETFIDNGSYLRILCPVDTKKHPDGWGQDSSPICQYGECCNFETASYVKEAICPICSMEVYGT